MTYKNLLYLATGLAAGAVSAWMLAKQHYAKKCWEEYDKLVAETFGEDGESDVVVMTNDLNDIPNEEAEGKTRSDLNAQAAKIASDNGYSKGKSEIAVNPDIDPYLITEDEYGATSYALEKVTWYPRHNVMTDEVGSEVSDPEVVGYDNLIAIDNDERLEGHGYVRNDKLGVDYEVTISYADYPPSDGDGDYE